MLEKRSCAAIDLGASSGRVALVEWDGDRLGLREVRRFDTPRCGDPETGYQCWNLDVMEHEVREGLAAAPPADLVLATYFVWHAWTCAERVRTPGAACGASTVAVRTRSAPIAHGVMSALMAAMFLGVT